MLDLKNENSRLRETNTAWMNFRNQALKLGRGFPSDGNSLLQQNIPNENPNSNVRQTSFLMTGFHKTRQAKRNTISRCRVSPKKDI